MISSIRARCSVSAIAAIGSATPTFPVTSAPGASRSSSSASSSCAAASSRPASSGSTTRCSPRGVAGTRRWNVAGPACARRRTASSSLSRGCGAVGDDEDARGTGHVQSPDCFVTNGTNRMPDRSLDPSVFGSSHPPPRDGDRRMAVGRPVGQAPGGRGGRAVLLLVGTRSLAAERHRGPRSDEVIEDHHLDDRQRLRAVQHGAHGELAEALGAQVATQSASAPRRPPRSPSRAQDRCHQARTADARYRSRRR